MSFICSEVVSIFLDDRDTSNYKFIEEYLYEIFGNINKLLLLETGVQLIAIKLVLVDQ